MIGEYRMLRRFNMEIKELNRLPETDFTRGMKRGLLLGRAILVEDAKAHRAMTIAERRRIIRWPKAVLYRTIRKVRSYVYCGKQATALAILDSVLTKDGNLNDRP